MANGRLAQTRIGVLGSGDVGRRLAEGFRGCGHDVMIGTRDPAKPELREWLSRDGAGIEAGTFAQTAAHGELLVLAVLGDAAEEAIAEADPDSCSGKVVKAFNTIGNPYFVHPTFSEGQPTMLIAGDDDGAKRTVGDVLADFGWSDTVDIGGIEGSRELEAICIAWVKIGGARGAFDHGFKLLVG